MWESEEEKRKRTNAKQTDFRTGREKRNERRKQNRKQLKK